MVGDVAEILRQLLSHFTTRSDATHPEAAQHWDETGGRRQPVCAHSPDEWARQRAAESGQNELVSVAAVLVKIARSGLQPAFGRNLPGRATLRND